MSLLSFLFKVITQASQSGTPAHAAPTGQPAGGAPRPTPTSAHQRSPSQQPVRTIYGPDRTGITAFHDNGFVVAKPALAHAAWLQERTAKLPEKVSGSYTNITDGLRVSLELLKNAPPGCLKRIYLLTDGRPNRDTGSLMAVVEEARRWHVNINTIGFGDPQSREYDPELLRRIAAATHNGKFIEVDSLRKLSEALVRGGIQGQGGGRHRSETSILAVDCSGSMMLPMEGKRRIDVVVEAITHLLHYKQQCFS